MKFPEGGRSRENYIFRVEQNFSLQPPSLARQQKSEGKNVNGKKKTEQSGEWTGVFFGSSLFNSGATAESIMESNARTREGVRVEIKVPSSLLLIARDCSEKFLLLVFIYCRPTFHCERIFFPTITPKIICHPRDPNVGATRST